ncbi:6-hydroxymethylpterin diphosphokinase MptE-like protein [Ornatilinea apprima]|uniref:6-hydroxymethylpterin diphosphokinase MptE-like protein n=1 Tax=Ornatilinea apprima TaxID=1134406 RepID=UPI0009E8BA3F|nr:6-hydroxymethylpterin diphosphokinase MptE-like protein [Ornatilinea apprima]
MSDIKNSLKKILPEPVIASARATMDAAARLKDWPQAVFHPWRRDTIANLARYKDIHRGERCFIIGNGPSLKNTDLSKLKGEYTFGMNRIYMLFEELGFETSYYVSINDLVIEQCAQDIQRLKLPRFISWRGRQWLQPDNDLFFLYTTYTGPKFSGDIRGRIWEGATVTNVALQIAYFMGFETVVLIGVDHSFATQGKPNTTVVSEGDDPNHFHPGYFGKGFRWQLPDLDTSERGYWMARQAYEKAGRKVLDATVGGKLQIFDKVEYSSLF